MDIQELNLELAEELGINIVKISGYQQKLFFLKKNGIVLNDVALDELETLDFLEKLSKEEGCV